MSFPLYFETCDVSHYRILVLISSKFCPCFKKAANKLFIILQKNSQNPLSRSVIFLEISEGYSVMEELDYCNLCYVAPSYTTNAICNLALGVENFEDTPF